MQDDFSPVGRSPVFEEINPLPGPKQHTPRSDRNGKLRLQERGPDMRGHIVRSFRPVDIALAVFRRDRFEKVFKIDSNVWVGVFLNKKRRRGMAAEYRQ